MLFTAEQCSKLSILNFLYNFSSFGVYNYICWLYFLSLYILKANSVLNSARYINHLSKFHISLILRSFFTASWPVPVGFSVPDIVLSSCNLPHSQDLLCFLAVLGSAKFCNSRVVNSFLKIALYLHRICVLQVDFLFWSLYLDWRLSVDVCNL